MHNWRELVCNRLADAGIDPVADASLIEELVQHMEDRYAETQARGDTAEAGLLQVGGDVEQVRVVQAQDGDAGRGEVAQIPRPPDDHAGERGPDLRVAQCVLGRRQPPSSFK